MLGSECIQDKEGKNAHGGARKEEAKSGQYGDRGDKINNSDE